MTRRMKKEMKLKRDTKLEQIALTKKRSCISKKQYNSDLEAMAWGRHANEKYNSNTRYNVYYCQNCFKWHLTSEG